MNPVEMPLSATIHRRQFLTRAAALGAALPASGAFLSACADEGSGGGGGVGDTLRVRLVGDMTNVDPGFFADTSVDEPIMSCVYEGLVTYEPGAKEFSVVNQLAERFEPSADGLSFDFTLKKGVPFHGGFGEVTADDVKFSYERIADPKLDAPYSGDWVSLREVSVKDKYSGTIILKERFAALMHSTLPVTSGYVLSRKAVEEMGEKHATQPIGTGPYEFAKWTPKQSIRLKRFKEYKTGFVEQPWKEIVLVPIAEDNSADIALETGDLHFAQIGLASVERFAGNDKFGTFNRPTLGYLCIGMNVLSPKLEDINVRKAIRLAIDVPSMLDAAFSGTYERANAVLPESMGLGYWAGAPQYDRDLDESKRLLKQAGVNSLELNYSYTEEPGANEVAEILQANLADIGIKVSLDKTDEGTFYELGKKLRDRDLVWINYETQPDPSWSMAWFLCDQFDQWNWTYWCDERFDRLQAEGLREQDDAKRDDIYVEMQKIWDENANVAWLAFPTHYYAHDKGVTPAVSPHGRILPQAFKPAAA
jgi:peptide/nickel transport system substrate-binding protein